MEIFDFIIIFWYYTYMDYPKKHPLGRKFGSEKTEQDYLRDIREFRERPFFIEDVQNEELDKMIRIDFKPLIEKFGSAKYSTPCFVCPIDSKLVDLACDQLCEYDQLFARSGNEFKRHAGQAFGWAFGHENKWRAQEGQWEGTYSPFFAHWLGNFYMYLLHPVHKFPASAIEQEFIEKYRPVYHKLIESKTRKNPEEYGVGPFLKMVRNEMSRLSKNSERYKELVLLEQEFLKQVPPKIKAS